MDPHAVNAAPVTSFLNNVYEGLVRRDANMAIEPSLATSWEPLEDTHGWRFHLREGVRFHDGADFTADDVLFSYERAVSESSDVSSWFAPVREVRVPDDFTIEFVTHAPNPMFPDSIANFLIMDRNWAETQGAELPARERETHASRNANGTGPFRLIQRDPGVETRLAPNEDWWDNAVVSRHRPARQLPFTRHSDSHWHAVPDVWRMVDSVGTHPVSDLAGGRHQSPGGLPAPGTQPEVAMMLTVANLSVAFTTRFGEELAVSGIDLNVEPGEIHGLVGESGAGKTTIGAAIMGLLADNAQCKTGQITLGETRLDLLSPAAMHRTRGKRVSMIFQDPQTSLNPLMTIEEQILETIQAHEPISDTEARQRAVDLLTELGIEEAHKRIKAYPHQFSGGMRQRVVIALALCTHPELIVADEPTTALDVAVQSQVLEKLRWLVRQRKVGIILITHDIGVIAQVSDRVTVLNRGRIVEQGPTKTVLGQPLEPYTQELIAAVPPLHKRLERFAVSTSREDTTRLGLAQEAIDWLGQREPSNSRHKTEWAIEIDNLCVTFAEPRQRLFGPRPQRTALDNLTLRLPEGEVLGLIGESGSGKSTLAKAIVGLVNPAHGQMRFQGKLLPPGRQRSRHHPSRRQIQMIFQDPYSSLNNRFPIGKLLAEPLIVYGIEPEARKRRRLIEAILALVGLPPAAIDRNPHQFSGGQRQRIAIARALLAQPDILICDEPTSALDVSIQAQILNLLKILQAEFALTLLFISHDLAVVRQMADHIAVLKYGQLLEHQPSEAFFSAPQHPYSKSLLSLTPSLDLAFSEELS